MKIVITLVALALWAGTCWANGDVGSSMATSAAQTAEFKTQLVNQINKAAIKNDVPVRAQKNKTFDFRITAPEGLGIGLGYTPIAPITVAVSVNSLLGASISGTGEVTFNLLWPRQWTKNCSLTATARLSHIVLTGLSDDLANQMVQRIYGTQITVKMAGRSLDTAAALGGVDCVFDRGMHVFAKAGYIEQLGESYGGDNSDGEVILRNWSGPAADFGIGWAY